MIHSKLIAILKENGKVELNKDQYMHWKIADWVASHGMEKFFQMDATGTLTVKDHGLFLIYAQVCTLCFLKLFYVFQLIKLLFYFS